MIINTLEIQGFKSYSELVKIEFPENCGILAILGENEVGKSSLFQSIEFALYGLKQKEALIKEDIITWGKDKAKVEMEFTIRDQRYLLSRELRRGSAPSRVMFAPIDDGKIDSINAISSVREIENKIEELLGLDNDSFRKLLYIRQKDLDALKDIPKSEREQLLNKIMGIDIFDDSTKLIKSELTSLKSELEKKELLMMNTIEPNTKSYEQKRDEKERLRLEMSRLNEDSSNLEIKLKQLQSRLDIQEWKSKYARTKELEESTCKNLDQALKQSAELEEKSQLLSHYNETIVIYDPKHKKLTDLIPGFQLVENEFSWKKGELQSLQKEKSDLMQKSGLSDNLGEPNRLVDEKRNQLRKFIALLITGIAFSTLAIFVSLYLFIFGISALMFCMFAWRSYQKADKLFTKTSDLRSINGRVTQCEELAKNYEDKLNLIKLETGFNSSESIRGALFDIKKQTKLVTGLESIEALHGASENLKRDIHRLQNEDVVGKRDRIKTELNKIRNSINNLDVQKPAEIKDLSYDEVEHENIKEEYNKVYDDWNNTKLSSQKITGQLGQLELDMKQLYGDYCLYLDLGEKILARKNQIEVFESVVRQYSETGKELRTKIIPYARMYINNILPLLTGGRYSDFNITEDLQFKVYSVEAGKYKDRDVFSGGTQDQFLIALRLAFTQSILNSRISADKYCMLMDECISSSDQSRKLGIFEVLRNSQSIFSQIFIIAHERLVERLVDHSMLLISDQNGYTTISSKTW